MLPKGTALRNRVFCKATAFIYIIISAYIIKSIVISVRQSLFYHLWKGAAGHEAQLSL